MEIQIFKSVLIPGMFSSGESDKKDDCIWEVLPVATPGSSICFPISSNPTLVNSRNDILTQRGIYERKRVGERWRNPEIMGYLINCKLCLIV